MKKIYKESELLEVNNIPSKVIESKKVTIDIVNENYGIDRDIEADLDGYVVIAENIVDIDILKQDKLKGLVQEYTDIIEYNEGGNWNSSLFLLCSNFSIIVGCTKDCRYFRAE